MGYWILGSPIIANHVLFRSWIVPTQNLSDIFTCLEPRDSEVQPLGKRVVLNATYPVEHDGTVTSLHGVHAGKKINEKHMSLFNINLSIEMKGSF